MSFICAINQETSLSHAITFDKNLNICASYQQDIKAYYPNQGGVEQNTQEVLISVINAIHKELNQTYLNASFLTDFVITNQSETSIDWGENGQITYTHEDLEIVIGAAIQWLREGIQFIEGSFESKKVAMFGHICGTSDTHIVRAMLESLALQTYDVLQAMQEDSLIKLTKLQVDKGASLNNYLMRYQVGILGVDVIRPMISETYALGACMLVSLVTQLFENENTLIQNWKTECVHNPTMSKSTQMDILEQWKRAIKTVLSYKEH